jgi:transposase
MRRSWADEEKRRIVEETLLPGASVAAVAQRHDLNANLLFSVTRQLAEGADSYAPIFRTLLLKVSLAASGCVAQNSAARAISRLSAQAVT